MMKAFLFAAALAAQADVPAAPSSVPFVVAVDDGIVEDTLWNTSNNANKSINEIVRLYETSGAPIPEVMSVWMAFPFNGNTVETRFVPVGNDVTGIGLETVYGVGEEVFDSFPPMRAMLIHNDVTALHERAALERLPDDGFGSYLFLLELSHVWGPQIRVPPAVAGGPADDVLIGFDFHWSFFLDAGGSPAGGNAWVDNGDGTFTAPVFQSSTVSYSPLDLYLMGLASADDVQPFGVLENVTVPADATDPFTRRRVDAQSFPWQGPGALTVTASRRTLTVENVITQNGVRSPAFGVSPTSFTLGTLLIVPAGLDDDARAQVVRDFVPVASSLAPAFARATGQRGTLEVVATSDAPAPVVTTPPPAPPPTTTTPTVDDNNSDDTTAQSGCAQTSATTAPLWLLAAALCICAPRKRRAH